MKKLNKKGFTLIELLAIIVILAIIMVITIPTVLSSMQKARQNSFDTAVATIVDYVQKQYDLDQTGADPDSVKLTFNDDGTIDGDIIANAGYKTADIAKVGITIVSGKATLSCATPGTDGKFAKVDVTKSEAGTKCS